jgi:hypothetical protein
LKGAFGVGIDLLHPLILVSLLLIRRFGLFGILSRWRQG